MVFWQTENVKTISLYAVNFSAAARSKQKTKTRCWPGRSICCRSPVLMLPNAPFARQGTWFGWRFCIHWDATAHRKNTDMNTMHSTKIICPSLCEKRIVFRLTFLLSKILSLWLFKTRQIRLGLIFLLQMGCISLVGITKPSKPYPVQREKTEKVDWIAIGCVAA